MTRSTNTTTRGGHRWTPFRISPPPKTTLTRLISPPVKEDEDPKDILRSNIIALVGLFRIMLSGLSPEEDAIVDRAISETASAEKTSPATPISPERSRRFFPTLNKCSGMWRESESLVERLSKYTRGTWAGFQSTDQYRFKTAVRRLLGRDMEDELKPVAMYIVTHYIWNAVRHEMKKRLLVIDEAWWMMKSSDTASFLYSVAKRGRKYLGVCTITQDVEDS